MNKTIKFFVNKKDTEKRVDIFLSKKIKDFTRSYIKKLIEKKNLKINNKVELSPSVKTKFKDKIFLNLVEKKEVSLHPSKIKLDIVYEDDDCLVFKDINPVAPIHLLIIPNKQIEKVADAKSIDQDLLGHLMLVAGNLARDLGVEDAFRLVVNNGSGAQQTVFHLHIHDLVE